MSAVKGAVKAAKAVKAPAAKAVKAPAAKAAKVKAPAPLLAPSTLGSAGAVEAGRAKLIELCKPPPARTPRAPSAYNLYLKEKLSVKPDGVSHRDHFAATSKSFKTLPAEEKDKYYALSKEETAKLQGAPPLPAPGAAPGAGILKLGSEAALTQASSSVTRAVLKGYFADVAAIADLLAPESSKKLVLPSIAQVKIVKDAKGVPTITLQLYQKSAASAEEPLPGK